MPVPPLHRLYGAIEDHPELVSAYHSRFGEHRDRARRAVLERARADGQLPPDTDVDLLLDVLTGAVWHPSGHRHAFEGRAVPARRAAPDRLSGPPSTGKDMPSTSVEAQLRTRAFARVIGPFLATVTTVIAIRLPEMGVLSNNLFANPVMVWMLAALMLAGGLVIIAGHRNWRGPLAVTVSLFGWFVALRGLLLLATPTTIRSGVDTALLSPTASLLARIFFGALAVVRLVVTCAGWFTTPVAASGSEVETA